MTYSILISRRLLAGLATLGTLLAAGCATSPKASLPMVQEAVSTHSGLSATWVQTTQEKQQAEREVASLLSQDLTPDRAVEIAVNNNRDLRVIFEDLGISQAELIAASRLRNPSFSASIRWPNTHPRGPNVEFSVAADLLDGVLIPVRKKIARAQLGQTEERVAHAVLALATEVKVAAFTVQSRKQLRARLAAIAETNDAAVDLAQRQYEAGNINQLELASQQAAGQQARLELMRTEAQLRADREKVNRLLGLSGLETEWKISAELPPLPAADTFPENLEDLAVAQRLDVAALKSQVSLAESAWSLKRKTRLLPFSLDIGAVTERESPGDRLTGPRVELGLPIFNQGQADLARLSAELRRATASYEGLVSDVRSQTREARNALLAARAVAEYCSKTLLPQYQLMLRETQLHYNAMQKSSYDLLVAKERQLSAERESIEALRDYWIARVELEMASGGRLPTPTPAAAPVMQPADMPMAEHMHHHGSE